MRAFNKNAENQERNSGRSLIGIIENGKEQMFYILISVMPAFLLMNRFAYLYIIAFLILILFSIVSVSIGNSITNYHYKFLLLLLLIYSYFILSYFLSRQPLDNFFSYGFLRFDGSFFFAYIPFLVFSIPYFNYRKSLKIYFRIMFIIFSLFSAFGLFEYMRSDFFQLVRIDRVSVGKMFVALNNSHNATGSVFAIAGIFALVFFLISKIEEKIAYGSVFLLCLLGLMITKSRGSLVAFACGVFFIFIVFSGTFIKFLRNAAIILFLGAAAIFATGTFERIKNIFYLADQNIITRLNLWEKAIFLIKLSPILGIGFGRYNDASITGSSEAYNGWKGIMSFYIAGNYRFDSSNSHNSYLDILSETGIVGLILVISFWIFCIIVLLKAYRNSGSLFNKKVYLAVSGGIITLFFLSLTENYMASPTVALCMATITALSIGLYWEENRKNEKRKRTAKR